MNAVRARQFLYVPVLREKRNSRYGLVCQYGFKVFCQREVGSFNFRSGFLAALFGVLNKPLYGSLHGAKHQCWSRQTDHFQCPDSLMKLLACDAQLTRINRGQIGAPGSLCVPDKTFKCFGGTVQRFAQFIQNPCQWAKVIDGDVKVSGC